MQGGDVFGYPWPGQTVGGVDEWLDEGKDDHPIEGYDELLEFDHNIGSPRVSEQLEPGEYPQYPSEQGPVEEDDEFLDSEDEDKASGTTQPLSDSAACHSPPIHEHAPMALDDEFLDDDDIEDNEDHFPKRIEFPPLISKRLLNDPSDHPMPAYSTTYIRPRSPQLSLGQAGAMIQIQGHADYHDDFLDSDHEVESEMGIYTADQYLPDRIAIQKVKNDLDADQHPPEPTLQSEMGVYTADQEFLDSESEDGLEPEMGEYTEDERPESAHARNQYETELESEMGVYTADQEFDPSQTSHSLNSDQFMSSRDGFWTDDEERVVFRIPSGPPIDLRHYQYPLDDLEDDFFMSDNEAMSTHSHSPVTPSQRNEAVDQFGLDCDFQPMELDSLIDHDKGQIMDLGSDDVLPFPPHDTCMLDEAMPP